MNPPEVAAVREALLVSDVAAHFGIALQKRGRNLIGMCPFHREKTGSFVIHASRNLYHCKGCGAGGDALRLIQRLEPASFPQAVRIGASMLGMVLSDDGWTPEQARQYRAQRAAALALAEEAAWVWQQVRARLVARRNALHRLERAAATERAAEIAWWHLFGAAERLERRIAEIDTAAPADLVEAYREVRSPKLTALWREERAFRGKLEAALLRGVPQEVQAA